MKQPVSIFEWFKAGCSSKRVRRKYARRALFKRFTVEELERRYQKHMFSLRPEEDQAVRQTIDQFKKCWYTAILAFEWIGTFYSPVSPLLTLFFIFFRDPIAVFMLLLTSFVRDRAERAPRPFPPFAVCLHFSQFVLLENYLNWWFVLCFLYSCALSFCHTTWARSILMWHVLLLIWKASEVWGVCPWL